MGLKRFDSLLPVCLKQIAFAAAMASSRKNPGGAVVSPTNFIKTCKPIKKYSQFLNLNRVLATDVMYFPLGSQRRFNIARGSAALI